MTIAHRAVAPTVVVLAALAAAPWLLSEFWLTNILDRALIYGIVALSLTFLATYGGTVSTAPTLALRGHESPPPACQPSSSHAVSYGAAGSRGAGRCLSRNGFLE